jgi:hypothetical protein
MRPRARLEEAMRASERPSDRAMVAMALQEDRLRAQQHPGATSNPPARRHPMERPVELHVPNTREQYTWATYNELLGL